MANWWDEKPSGGQNWLENNNGDETPTVDNRDVVGSDHMKWMEEQQLLEDPYPSSQNKKIQNLKECQIKNGSCFTKKS